MQLFVVILLSSVLALYLWGWRAVHGFFRGVLRPWRAAAFFAGVLTLGAVLGSPLSTLDHHSLTAHMVQHLLIMTIAAPLILLGAPVAVLMHLLPAGVSGAFSRRALFVHPVICWLAGVAVVIAWHVPAIFGAGMKSEGWHTFEQATFLIGGLLFWRPVIRPWPAMAKWPPWSTPVYLFLATLPCDALSAFLCLCNRVVYPHYSPNQLYNLTALKDQACAGALMWVWVTFAYLLPAAALTFRQLSPERRFAEKAVVRL